MAAAGLGLALLGHGALACGARESLGLSLPGDETRPPAPFDAGGSSPGQPPPVMGDASADAVAVATPPSDAAPVPNDPAPPPPWELDGGYEPDALCGGETLPSGACLVTLASGQPTPAGEIAIDQENVYWATESGSQPALAKVGRTGGTPVTFATGLRSASGLAVDGTSVYVDGHAIVAVGTDGGAPRTLFDDSNSFTAFVTRAGSKIYWADSDFNFGVRSCNLDGSGLAQLVGPSTMIGGLSVSTTGIVFSETTDTAGVPGKLVSATLDGAMTTLLTTPGGLGLVKSAKDVVVYTDGFRAMYWIPLAGGSPSLLTSDSYATDIVTDGTYVYWTDANLRALMKLEVLSGAPVVLVSYEDTPMVTGNGFLTIDSSSVYFTDSGRVLKLTPR